MSKSLEKKTDKNKGKKLAGHEIECKLFIYHTMKLFPDMSAIEMRRMIARHVHVLVSYDWCRIQISEYKNSQDWLREVGEDLSDKVFVKADQRASEGAALITADSRKQVAKIVEDSQVMAKSIKGKAMVELDTRLDADVESFTNDEIIKSAKVMHDIEHNTDNSNKVIVNLIEVSGGLDEYKQTLNELNKRKEATIKVEDSKSGGGETKTDNGKVQER